MVTRDFDEPPYPPSWPRSYNGTHGTQREAPPAITFTPGQVAGQTVVRVTHHRTSRTLDVPCDPMVYARLCLDQFDSAARELAKALLRAVRQLQLRA